MNIWQGRFPFENLLEVPAKLEFDSKGATRMAITA